VVVAGVAAEMTEAKRHSVGAGDTANDAAVEARVAAIHAWGSGGRREEREREKKAREGLVRAYLCDQEIGFEVEKWSVIDRLERPACRRSAPSKEVLLV